MKLAISAWSFHALLYTSKLRQSDVPARVADLGVRHVELLEMFLWPRPPGLWARAWRKARRAAGQPAPAQPDYGRQALSDLRSARLRAGVGLVCWDIDTDLAQAGPDARRAEMAHVGVAIEAARYLGAPLIRLTLGGEEGQPAGVGLAIDMLRSIIPAAMAARVRLAIENHGGLSADPRALAEVVSATAGTSQAVGVCLDLGNWRPGGAEEGIRLLAPLAVHVHCKSNEFDAAGEETRIQYPSALQALQSAGYDGVLSVEYEGGLDPAAGIRKTLELVKRYWHG